MSTRAARVVHVTTAHPRTDNRIFRKECVSLVQAGFDVHLVAVGRRDEDVDGVHVVAIRGAGSRWARMLLRPLVAWRALADLQGDVVHVHDPELIPLAVLWRLLHRSAVVYDAHEDLAKQVMGKGYLPPPLRPFVARAARLLESAADRWLDAVVVATPAIARNFTRAPVTLVQNFPWLRDFPEVVDWPGEGENVAYVGAIARSRGAIEMMQAIKDSKHCAQLVLAGPVESESLMLQIDVSEATHYLGRVPADDIPALLSEARLGLAVLHPLPNYLEAQATKIFEYMAAGRPFIASDFPSWRALLEPIGCGVFVDPLDVAGLTVAIDELLSDSELARSMGKRGRAALVDRFCFEPEAAKLVDLVVGLVND